MNDQTRTRQAETQFDTSVLDQAIAERSARWEAERQDLLARLLHWLDEHGRRYTLSQAYIFGSIARPGRFTDRSDIDVAVTVLPDTPFFALMAALSTAMGRDVDLIDLNQCHFADKIQREGILWTPSN